MRASRLGIASALVLTISADALDRSGSAQAAPQAAPEAPIVDLVPRADLAKLHRVCECSLYLDSHSAQSIFETYEHRARALMRLEGTLVSLVFFGASGDDRCVVGTKHEENWRGLGLRAVIKLQVDSVGVEAESCGYLGQIEVTTPRGHTTRVVKGACGC